MDGRVFVTGGSGFIGRALVRRLRDGGAEVVGLARSDTAARVLAGEGIQVARGDVRDEGALVAQMARCRTVFHVAGENSLCPADAHELVRVNVEGSAAVARAAARAGVGRLVHTSSASTLGEARGTVGREDSPHRGSFLSAYERSKHAAERAVLEGGRAAGLEVVCVNPSSVQGPGRAGGTGRILLAMVDERLRVFLDTRISLVDVDDCVEGHLRAARRGRPGERYVLCGGTLTSREAFALVGRVTGAEVNPRIVPAAVALGLGVAVEAAFRAARRPPPVCRAMVRTLLHGHAYDGSRATRELGLTYLPLEETLRRTVRWAAAEGLIRRSAQVT